MRFYPGVVVFLWVMLGGFGASLGWCVESLPHSTSPVTAVRNAANTSRAVPVSQNVLVKPVSATSSAASAPLTGEALSSADMRPESLDEANQTVGPVRKPTWRNPDRLWSDVSGEYSARAALVDEDDQTVILKKTSGRLIAVTKSELSRADRDFLQTDEAKRMIAKHAPEPNEHLWNLKDGATLCGRVTRYGCHEMFMRHDHGVIYVDGRDLLSYPEAYQTTVREIVEYFAQEKILDNQALVTWMARQHGESWRFLCEGVRIAWDNGEDYAVPFFLFSKENEAFLRPGYEKWLDAELRFVASGRQPHDTNSLSPSDTDAINRLAFEYSNESRRAGGLWDTSSGTAEQDRYAQQLANLALRARTADYQRDLISRRMVELMAVSAGLIDEWRVTMIPNLGTEGTRFVAIVPARDSYAAMQTALRSYPGYTTGTVGIIWQHWR